MDPHLRKQPTRFVAGAIGVLIILFVVALAFIGTDRRLRDEPLSTQPEVPDVVHVSGSLSVSTKKNSIQTELIGRDTDLGREILIYKIGNDTVVFHSWGGAVNLSK